MPSCAAGASPPARSWSATIRHHDAVIGCLREGGFTIAGAAHAFSVLDSYLYGFVIQEVSLPFAPGVEADLEEVAAGIMEALPREQFPHFSEMVSEHALRPGYAYADEFDVGLELLPDGLARAQDRW